MYKINKFNFFRFFNNFITFFIFFNFNIFSNIDKFIYSYYDATDKCGVVVMDIDDELYSFEVNETPHKIMKKIAEKKNEIKEK